MPIVGALVSLLVREAPALVQAGTEIYDHIRNRRRSRTAQSDAETVNIQALSTAITNIAERIEALEDTSESQADLVVMLSKHNAILARWLLILGIVATISAGVATAALILVILQ